MRNTCFKIVGALTWQLCSGTIIKYGKVNSRQRYKCKACNRAQMKVYANNACQVTINKRVAAYVKEGCGIRSIARLLGISINTVLRRIREIANTIVKPIIKIGRRYEVDKLKTYIKWLLGYICYG